MDFFCEDDKMRSGVGSDRNKPLWGSIRGHTGRVSIILPYAVTPLTIIFFFQHALLYYKKIQLPQNLIFPFLVPDDVVGWY